jgi:hypothetical protein
MELVGKLKVDLQLKRNTCFKTMTKKITSRHTTFVAG